MRLPQLVAEPILSYAKALLCIVKALNIASRFDILREGQDQQFTIDGFRTMETKGGFNDTLEALATCNASLGSIWPILASYVPQLRMLPGYMDVVDKALERSFRLQNLAQVGFGNIRLPTTQGISLMTLGRLKDAGELLQQVFKDVQELGSSNWISFAGIFALHVAMHLRRAELAQDIRATFEERVERPRLLSCQQLSWMLYSVALHDVYLGSKNALGHALELCRLYVELRMSKKYSEETGRNYSGKDGGYWVLAMVWLGRYNEATETVSNMYKGWRASAHASKIVEAPDFLWPPFAAALILSTHTRGIPFQ